MAPWLKLAVSVCSLAFGHLVLDGGRLGSSHSSTTSFGRAGGPEDEDASGRMQKLQEEKASLEKRRKELDNEMLTEKDEADRRRELRTQLEAVTREIRELEDKKYEYPDGPAETLRLPMGQPNQQMQQHQQQQMLMQQQMQQPNQQMQGGLSMQFMHQQQMQQQMLFPFVKLPMEQPDQQIQQQQQQQPSMQQVPPLAISRNQEELMNAVDRRTAAHEQKQQVAPVPPVQIVTAKPPEVIAHAKNYLSLLRAYDGPSGTAKIEPLLPKSSMEQGVHTRTLQYRPKVKKRGSTKADAAFRAKIGNLITGANVAMQVIEDQVPPFAISRNRTAAHERKQQVAPVPPVQIVTAEPPEVIAHAKNYLSLLRVYDGPSGTAKIEPLLPKSSMEQGVHTRTLQYRPKVQYRFAAPPCTPDRGSTKVAHNVGGDEQLLGKREWGDLRKRSPIRAKEEEEEEPNDEDTDEPSYLLCVSKELSEQIKQLRARMQELVYTMNKFPGGSISEAELEESKRVQTQLQEVNAQISDDLLMLKKILKEVDRLDQNDKRREARKGGHTRPLATSQARYDDKASSKQKGGERMDSWNDFWQDTLHLRSRTREVWQQVNVGERLDRWSDFLQDTLRPRSRMDRAFQAQLKWYGLKDFGRNCKSYKTGMLYNDLLSKRIEAFYARRIRMDRRGDGFQPTNLQLAYKDFFVDPWNTGVVFAPEELDTLKATMSTRPQAWVTLTEPQVAAMPWTDVRKRRATALREIVSAESVQSGVVALKTLRIMASRRGLAVKWNRTIYKTSQEISESVVEFNPLYEPPDMMRDLHQWAQQNQGAQAPRPANWCPVGLYVPTEEVTNGRTRYTRSFPNATDRVPWKHVVANATWVPFGGPA